MPSTPAVVYHRWGKEALAARRRGDRNTQNLTWPGVDWEDESSLKSLADIGGHRKGVWEGEVIAAFKDQDH